MPLQKIVWKEDSLPH